MSNGPTYRFFLDTGGTPAEVYPIYDDGLEKVTTRADGEQYYRTTLNGAFSFVRDDYDTIAAAALEDQFSLIAYKADDDGNLNTYFQGHFTKPDCVFSVDECGEGICTVALTPNDKYEKLLGSLDKEFDLIDLAPEKTAVRFFRQPIFQVYALGDDVITCYLGGTYFELDVPTPITSTATLFSTYFFGYIGTHIVIYGDDLDPDVSGEYINEGTLDDVAAASSTWIRKGDGAYRIQLNGGDLSWEIVDATTSALMYQTGPSGALFEAEFAAIVTGDICYSRGNNLFLRFITNQLTVGVTPTTAIPASDIVSNPAGYERVLAVGLTNLDIPAGTNWESVIIASGGHSTSPTRWGKYADDAPLYASEYFTIPDGAGTGAIYPQGESSWASTKTGASLNQNASFWFQYDSVLRAFQESGAETLTLADGYKIADALSVILAAIDSNLSHAESDTYSDFLYGASNSIRGDVKYPIITPKSNIVVGQYDQPAKKGPIKLSDILQFLWVAYRCKWHIDLSGNFIVEHISYYENGGTYTGTSVGTDLTTLIDPQTGKNWEWGANKWSYDKSSMPERIESGWMDRTTREFDGYPIQIRSLFVQKGNIDNQKAGKFTSDIDYMQLQPTDISKEGFAVMEATEYKGIYTLPYVEITLPDASEFKLQNGYLAFIWLHPNYHRYGLPASLVTINEEDTTALSIIKRKIQEVDYPLLTITDYLALVTTALGDAKIVEASENVSGQYVKAKLAHDTN